MENADISQSNKMKLDDIEKSQIGFDLKNK